MTEAMLFTALIPLALLGVLALTLVSGRLPAGARDRIERLFILVAYPGIAAFWTWQAWDSGRQGDQLLALGFAVAAACMAAQGAIVIRKRGVPWSGAAAR